MRVLVIDAIAPEGTAYLEERGLQVDQVLSKMPRAELFATIATYEAIVTRSSTTVNVEFLGHARRLRFLGRAGVGVDNIDIEECSASARSARAWPRGCAPSTWTCSSTTRISPRAAPGTWASASPISRRSSPRPTSSPFISLLRRPPR